MFKKYDLYDISYSMEPRKSIPLPKIGKKERRTSKSAPRGGGDAFRKDTPDQGPELLQHFQLMMQLGLCFPPAEGGGKTHHLSQIEMELL